MGIDGAREGAAPVQAKLSSASSTCRRDGDDAHDYLDTGLDWIAAVMDWTGLVVSHLTLVWIGYLAQFNWTLFGLD